MTLTEQTKTIKTLVLDKVRQLDPRPTELLFELRSEAYPIELENALSELLDEGEIFFTSDGRLRMV